MKKRVIVLLLAVVLAVVAPLYSAQDNSGPWTAGILIGGLLAGMCWGFTVGDQQENVAGFWGTHDNHTFFIGPIFNSTWTDMSNKTTDAGFGLVGVYRAMLHSSNKWFGIIRNGFEADGDMVATFTEKEPLRFLTGAFGFGPNFSLFELGSILRITCGVGYMCNLFMVNAFYVRPGIDFRVTENITINAMFLQTFFGGYGDPTTPNFVNCFDRRLEVGASYLIGERSNPAAISLRYRYGALGKNTTDGGTLQYHSALLAYTFSY